MPSWEQPIRHHLRTRWPKIVTMPAKQAQRKPRQEAKAEITALLEKIEKIELSLLKAVVKRSGFWMLIMTEISVFGDAEHGEGIVPMTSNWNIWRHLQLPKPKVEFVEGYEMEEEDMEDFATGISGNAQRWL
ncbi:unnamed protein product [Sphagnum jensenii]|uniref:Uncharacterized protein n=1 Tax=Sphagnum jensenii TaxID=128206 RepID=A0ABP1AZL0_9BRYO